MFNIFKKKNKISTADFDFLKNVTEKLPKRYEYLKTQVNTEFIIGKELNVLGKGSTYTLLLNANLEKIYLNKDLPELFIIKNILVWNEKNAKNEIIDFHVVEGILAGYRLDCNSKDLDFAKISMSRIIEKHYFNKDKEKVDFFLKDIKPEVKAMLNIETAFKTIIEDKEYFIIKDLGDGNYISIDTVGKVFGMIHDPYQLDKIFDTTEDFILKLSSGEFSFEGYLNGKLS